MGLAGLVLKYVSISVAVGVALYATVILLLTTNTVQSHVVYLHKIQMTWFKDLDSPEQFGFLHNQATPFFIKDSEGNSLYAWHILPLGVYRKNEEALRVEPSGLVLDFTSRLAFKFLQEDPEARLILHMHRAAGTIHVLTFDYRGFGRSPGTPSECGLLADALAVADWAMESLGTVVTLGISEYYALQSPPVVFAGIILVAPFSDVAALMATYKVAGTIPIVSPLARFPALFNYILTLTNEKWLSKDRIESYVRVNEVNGEKYRLTLIHAQEDYDIPWQHTETVFWYTVKSTMRSRISREELEEEKLKSKRNLGSAGSIMEWRTQNGFIREEIIKHGLHDVVMGYPIVMIANMRMLAKE